MKKLGFFALLGVFLAAVLCVAPAAGQTSNTALILGTITDPGGAVVPDAKVDLTNTATNDLRSMMTNSVGQYTFPGVPPGSYTLKITKAGFATTVIANIKLDVARSYTHDAKLEIRATSEVVEVTAEARAELQTTDAVIGGVVGGTTLSRLPTLGRDASELLTLQPGSTPYDSAAAGQFGNNGGTIAGARSDQNSVILDGIDITDNVITGGGNQKPIIPVGVDSIDEFRVGVTNNNASFGRSSGGQISLISKSGTNAFHGSAYWFHQNSALNANSWENNHTADADAGTPFIKKSVQRDNRAGAAVGGPIRKDKTFFMANYEFRRFFQAFNITRLVPTDSLKSGTLTFTDCALGFDAQGNCLGGNPVSYDLQTSALCGAGGNLACDPRGLGISPTIQSLWNLMPPGNDSNLGDQGVNIIGFRGTAPSPLKDDFVAFKLDHSFTDKVHFFGRYAYSRDVQPNGSQIDLRSGKAVTPSGSNIRGDTMYGGLEWQIRNNLTNSFRGGWVRSRQDFTVIQPRASAQQLALNGTSTGLADVPNVALAPGLVQTNFLDTAVDVDTQRARHQAIYDSSKQYADTLTWVKGTHTVVTGMDVRWLPTIHDRDDKVVGSLNSLVAGLDADVNFLTIPQANRPPTCAPGGATTNCIQSGDVQRWDRLYAASLGLIDNVGILIARDGDLQPKPLGASLIAKTTLRMYDFFAQDTWRIKPSFTLTYGLAYGWQTTPHEQNKQQTFIVNHDAGDQIISGQEYIDQKAKAAEQGQIFNPSLGYLPVGKSGRGDVFSVDYGDWAPRVSAAWNPSFRSGPFGRVFGDRKTVVRGGYGISYDRINTVQSVIIPMLGVGFAQTINLITPACDATGPGGTNCGIDGTPGGGIFRVGVDGDIPIPPLPTASTSPVVPPGGSIFIGGFGELLSFQDDANFKVGRSHMFDFTIQRELPGNMLMEVGYIGRLGRDLPNAINFNSSPIMFKDTASGQTFGEAFDAVATALRNGQTPGDQPWFENQIPAFSTQNICDTPTQTFTNTGCMVALNSAGFTNGNVATLFLIIDALRQFPTQVGGPGGLQPFNNNQVFDLFMRTHRDISNYHALIFTLRNRGWHGIQFDMNYTFSKSLDQIGTVQNSASYYGSSFNRRLQYGPSFFDRTHVFNMTYNYDLPFGKGHRLGSSHAAVDKFIGGWYVAGIFRHASGLPQVAFKSNQAFGGGSIFGVPNGLIPTSDPSSLNTGRHDGVTGSGGVGTAGDPDTGGTGINIFSDPEAASKIFRDILLASDGRDGRSRPLRGFPYVSWDARVGKLTSITERVKAEFSFDFFNALNNVNFLDPSFDLTNQSTFGVVNTQYIPANRNAGSRWIQFGFRLNF